MKQASAISVSEANKIMDEIIESHNNEDAVRLYDVFGDYAKTIMTKEEFIQQYESVVSVGKMNKASYSHTTHQRTDGDVDWYDIIYLASYEKGNGTATVTIRAVNGEWEVTGFNFSIDDIRTAV